MLALGPTGSILKKQTFLETVEMEVLAYSL